MGELTSREREILDLENETWMLAGHKEDAIRERFGDTPTAYYQALSALIEREEALAYRPVLVARLRRIAQSRRR